MPPPPMLLPRRLLVGVTAGAKPVRIPSFSLLGVGLGFGCRRSYSASYSSSSSSRSSSTSSRRFSSNAEQSAGSRRRWWSEETQFDDADDEEEFEDDEFRGSASWTDQAFEEPWFTKVWRAYGYVLPVILVSILAATGPRAFLMALAIPLAQSAASFAVRAFSNTFGRRRDDREEEYDDNDDYYYYYSDYRSSGWESEDAAEDSSSYSTNSKQPWAGDAKPEDSVPAPGSDDTVSASSSSSSSSNGTSNSGSSSSAGFGGWDELDAGDDQYVRSSRKPSAGASPAADAAAKTASAGGAARSVGRRRRPAQPETPTRGRRRPRSRATARYRGQSPLFMRLLVAVFPFLGSWFRIML